MPRPVPSPVPSAGPRGHAPGEVVAVARDGRHRFSKTLVDAVTLRAGHGVEGDAHAGATVQHRSIARRRPQAPNLRQVHLMHAELFDRVALDGFAVGPGELGENITTRGVPLLDLPEGTVLRLGEHASVRVTGLRNPCRQIDDLAPGLMARVLATDPDGTVRRLSGVMSVVLTSGVVRAGDPIGIDLPPGVHVPLGLV